MVEENEEFVANVFHTSDTVKWLHIEHYGTVIVIKREEKSGKH